MQFLDVREPLTARPATLARGGAPSARRPLTVHEQAHHHSIRRCPPTPRCRLPPRSRRCTEVCGGGSSAARTPPTDVPPGVESIRPDGTARRSVSGVTTRPTLAAVAARAGVSPSTASLAFAGSPRVAAPTRDRVLAAAADLGYAGPDPLAASLRRGRSGVIGAFIGERLLYAFRDPVAVQLLDGITEVLGSHGVGLLLLAGDTGRPSAQQIARIPLDAAIFATCGLEDDPALDQLRARGVPVVGVEGPVADGVTLIDIDDRAGTRELARHLHQLGHRRVAVVAMPLRLDGTRGPLDAARRARVHHRNVRHRLQGVGDVFGPTPAFETASNAVDEGAAAGRALVDVPADRGDRAERHPGRRGAADRRRARAASARRRQRDRLRRRRSALARSDRADHRGATHRREGPRRRPGRAGPCRSQTSTRRAAPAHPPPRHHHRPTRRERRSRTLEPEDRDVTAVSPPSAASCDALLDDRPNNFSTIIPDLACHRCRGLSVSSPTIATRRAPHADRRAGEREPRSSPSVAELPYCALVSHAVDNDAPAPYCPVLS
jgi:DNA-binding LacI/PurR family transcriptional regulator